LEQYVIDNVSGGYEAVKSICEALETFTGTGNWLRKTKKFSIGLQLAEMGVDIYQDCLDCLDFKESNFRNVVTGEGTFSADVISASALLGTDRALNDMKIYIEYTETMFQKMTITYTTPNSIVTLVYVFDD
jgi:hypothetical protein